MKKNILATSVILYCCNNDMKKMMNAGVILRKEFGIEPKKIMNFFFSCCETAKHTIYRSNEEKQYLIVPMIIMILGCEEKEAINKMKNKLWMSLTASNDRLREDFIEIIDVIYHLISIIADYDPYVDRSPSFKP